MSHFRPPRVAKRISSSYSPRGNANSGLVVWKHAKRPQAALASLKDLQDSLGALNDITTREKLASRVAMSARHMSMSSARELAFAAGLISGSQEAHLDPLLKAAEHAYARLLEVKPFWT